MADKDPLFDDPIGGKPPIDVAQERALEEAEPLGYVDPESQKDVEGYAPDPAEVENPSAEAAQEGRGQEGGHSRRREGRGPCLTCTTPSPGPWLRSATRRRPSRVLQEQRLARLDAGRVQGQLMGGGESRRHPGSGRRRGSGAGRPGPRSGDVTTQDETDGPKADAAPEG